MTLPEVVSVSANVLSALQFLELGTIGADSTGSTGNFAPVLMKEPGQTLPFAPVTQGIINV